MSFALACREAIVVLLRADPILTGMIPAGSIYGERVPDDRTFPFIRVTVPTATPFRTSGWNGEQVDPIVSAFVKGATMDDCAAADARIKAVLEGAVLDMGNGEAIATWTGGSILSDPAEPDSWHSNNTFTAA